MGLTGCFRVASLLALGLCALAVAPARAADRLAVTEYGVAATALPWGVAQEEGFFKAAGVPIDGIVTSNGGGTVIRNMIASGLPFAEVATSAAVAAVEAGIDVVFVYSANNNTGDMAWLVKPASPLKTLADLKGHKAGYSNPRSTTEMMLDIVLHKAGLEHAVTTMPMGGIAAGLTILDQGLIDAAPADEPALLPAGKYRTLFTVRDQVPEITWTIGITTRAFAKAHPEMVRGLILARRKAVDFMEANPDAAAKVYARDWQMDPAVARNILNKLFAIHYFSRGDFNMPALQTMIEAIKVDGALTKPIDLDKLIDKSFLPQDLR